MAASCLRSSSVLIKRLVIYDNVGILSQFQVSSNQGPLGHIMSVRHGSFFNRQKADDLWKSNTTVSSQGRRRGRASRGKLMQKENLSFGRTGEGKSGMMFPGLTEPIRLKDPSTFKMHQDDSRIMPDKEIKKITKKRTDKTDILNRGYSGGTIDGKKIGPPEPVEDYEFKDFESVVLKSSLVGTTTAAQGTMLSPFVLVAVGNGKGLIGIATSKGSSTKAAMANARKKAAQRLVYIERFEGHTIQHNFNEQFVRSKVIAYGMHKGYGLVCCRVIKTLCELIGIKDIHVKVERNNKNYLAVSRAFINGLLKQKTLQDIADETGHHVVEYRAEKSDYPVIVASPSENANTNFVKDYQFDFETYCFGEKTYLKKKRFPFYAKFDSYKKRKVLDKRVKRQVDSKMQRMVLGLEREYKAR